MEQGFGCGLVKSETPFRTVGGDTQEADGLMSLELRKRAERGWLELEVWQ